MCSYSARGPSPSNISLQCKYLISYNLGVVCNNNKSGCFSLPWRNFTFIKGFLKLPEQERGKMEQGTGDNSGRVGQNGASEAGRGR